MKKLRCAFLDDYQGVGPGLADWAALADRVEVFSVRRHCEDVDELVRSIGDCEIVVIMRERTRFDASVFARLTSLKLLVTSGLRNQAIDLEAAARHGVTVCGTRSLSEPPLELTWALLLGVARSIVAENGAMRDNGPWQSTIGVDLHGKTLGILGLGRIGSRAATIGAAFGMKCLAWSQNLTPQVAAERGVTLAESKRALLEQSDFLTIHVVLSERTRGLIGRDDLRQMKRTAILVNTSRAGIVDQDALIEALREGWIAGAGLDVFDEEPLPPDHPYRTLENVLATPHLGYVSEANYRIYYGEAFETIRAWLSGAPLRTLA